MAEETGPCAPVEDATDNELLNETDADYTAEETQEDEK